MTLWKYSDSSRLTAFRTLDSGDTESRFASAITESIIAPDILTKPQQKAAVTGGANAFGFSIDQIRILRAVLLLITGTPQQKMDATAFLQPLLNLLQNVSAATTAIDANQVPAVIPKPILSALDP